MTPLPSPQPSGKRLGEQFREGRGRWVSKRARSTEATSGELTLPPEAVDYDSLGAIPMPEAAADQLQHTSCCFPYASPVSPKGPGKQKTAPKDRSKLLIILKKSGAGEGIRTLDPNLGKILVHLLQSLP
jgi:hypothetical protein